jgi:hypothetical protein
MKGGLVDFFKKATQRVKGQTIEVFPEFSVQKSSDIMIRGGRFYAIWDSERNTWVTDEYQVQVLIDGALYDAKKEIESRVGPDTDVVVKPMSNFSNGHWIKFKNYTKSLQDNYVPLDSQLTFSNTETKKSDHTSKRLPYPLEKGSFNAYEELMSVLYEPSERKKLEWAIGSIVSGDSKTIQKFIVLYGEPGGGKSTVLNIIQKLFTGYYTTFDAKALTTSGNNFSTEVFKDNPLVSIQHDGDLSRIEDNTILNSIISHEEMMMSEKYKSSYTAVSQSMLFVGTNKPVKISDGKSGIIRRLIDVRTSGRKVSPKRYHILTSQIDFELGAIASHCLEVYKKMGRNYYSGYRPLDMILQTDVFYNFVESNYFVFKNNDGISLVQAYELFKNFCLETGLDFKIPRHKFREELKVYFKHFDEVKRVEGVQVRSYYSGFIDEKFTSNEKQEDLNLDESDFDLSHTESILDLYLKDCPAQYATEVEETPSKKWINVDTKLENINSGLLHYLKPPRQHIVIDFDLKDKDGKKSLPLNIAAASKWPPTYSEVSKSGYGLHLHYEYEGDIARLSRIFEFDIEIKVFNGDASLRRKLTRCNNLPIAKINSGLPLKGEKRVYDSKTITQEKTIVEMILRNIEKEIHPNTRPSVDFIKKILDDAYESGVRYDVTHLRHKLLNFALGSTNQSEYCVKVVSNLQLKSNHEDTSIETNQEKRSFVDDKKVFFDIECFPNLFLLNWKYEGIDEPTIRMINPTSEQIESLLEKKLIGFNCRRYDNHVLYARFIGMSIEEVYNISQRIIDDDSSAMFREAYSISYTDVFDFASAKNKKSLKKWEIELGIEHRELGLDWTKPVPESQWHTVAEYCDHDVFATETVFNHLAGDWMARLILAELSGLTPNDTTNSHATKIMFGEDKTPQDKFVYTDLSKDFPGYVFDNGKSTYRGEESGEGGYVFAKPGIYENVALLDVASMHPSSIEALNLFGKKYTDRYRLLKEARIAIKHKDETTLNTILDGKLKKFIERSKAGEFTLTDLSNALKTVLVSVYGLTSARFDNPFRDKRNKDNIVAKRGALFMIDLKYALFEKGYEVAHIKTDSVKIPNATQEVIDFVFEFGKKYGYQFEHETTYSKMCLVNDAVYIAKDEDGSWQATGAEFAHPYIYKKLFTKEELVFEDFCETKNVTASIIYLDFNEGYNDVKELEEELIEREKEQKDPEKKTKKKRPYKDLSIESLTEQIASGHNYVFVGKISSFVPVKPGKGGGILYRFKDGKYFSITGTKGYRWMESSVVKDAADWRSFIDMSYYSKLLDDAVDHISTFGSFDNFVK